MNRQFEVAIVLEKLSRHHKFQAAVRLCMLNSGADINVM